MSSRPFPAQGECRCGRDPDQHAGRVSGQSLFDMRLRFLTGLLEAAGIRLVLTTSTRTTTTATTTRSGDK
eukprot:7845888-Heterocapsa_arctica.AAC.1